MTIAQSGAIWSRGGFGGYANSGDGRGRGGVGIAGGGNGGDGTTFSTRGPADASNGAGLGGGRGGSSPSFEHPPGGGGGGFGTAGEDGRCDSTLSSFSCPQTGGPTYGFPGLNPGKKYQPTIDIVNKSVLLPHFVGSTASRRRRPLCLQPQILCRLGRCS